MNFHVIVCNPEGRYKYLDSVAQLAIAKSLARYWAHRGGTSYITSSALLAVKVMANLAPITYDQFHRWVKTARNGNKKAKTLCYHPPMIDGCPWCGYDAGKPLKHVFADIRCKCPACGGVSHLDAWYVKHQGRAPKTTWFTSK